MAEADIKAWINKQENIQRVVGEFFSGQSRQAVFMAGIPGAGKTEFVDNLKLNPYFMHFITIEHDKLVEYLPGYQPENYYRYRSAGSTIVNHLLKRCLECSHSFILDGTLAHNAGLANIKKVLGRGYEVQVVYIVLGVAKAWDATQKREKVVKRGIEGEGFVATCKIINQKLLDIFTTYASDNNFRFIYADKKDSIAPSVLHEILDSKIPEEAEQIRKRLGRNYDIDQDILRH